MNLFGDPFHRVIGQAQVTDSLGRMLDRGRMPHALLFGGPSGIGKRTTALIFAKTLLFGTDDVSDDALMGHADFHVLAVDETARSRQIKVDQARQLLHRTRQTRGSASWQIILIDTANDLNTETANLLLKFLEEPSDGTIILLLSDQPQALLPTIRSRCALLRFRRLPDESCRIILDQLEIDAPVDDVLVIADGRPGWLVRMMEQSWWSEFSRLIRQLRDNQRPIPDEAAVFALLRKVDEVLKSDVLEKLAHARLCRSGFDAPDTGDIDKARLESDVRLWETLTDFRAAADGLYLDARHADGRLARLLTSP